MPISRNEIRQNAIRFSREEAESFWSRSMPISTARWKRATASA